MEAMSIGIAFVAYLLTTILYIVSLAVKKESITRVANYLLILGFLFHTIGLVVRTVVSKHAPFTNIYESMVFFSWGIVLVYFFINKRYKLKAIGAFVAPLALLTIGYASVLPADYKGVEPLVPALQSFWLEIHVVTAMISYAAFAIAFGASVMYVIKSRSNTKKLPSTKVLDNLTYRSIAFGFPLLTLGVITGAIWANYAWGSYWSWDTKETWSLVTWFIYAAYLHARVTAKWTGKRSIYISIIGFIAVIFTYLGVNFLLSGLHSYK